MIILAFHNSYSLNTKGCTGSEKKTYSSFIQNFYFQSAPYWIKVLCKNCITCKLNKPYPNQKQLAENKILKDKVYILFTESHSIQKNQYQPPQKETHI